MILFKKTAYSDGLVNLLINWFGGDAARQIANAHTAFNVFTTILLLPFIPFFVKICEKILPLKNNKVKYQRLEPHLLDTPPIALAQTTSSLRQMLQKAWKMIDCSLKIYIDNDEKNQSIVRQLEKREADIDERQKDITEYLSQLMRRNLTKQQAEQIPMLLHCTNDVERIGDHTEIIRNITEKLNNDNIRFSPEAEAEFSRLHKTLTDLADSSIDLLADNDMECHDRAKLIQQRIFSMLDQSEAEHLARINSGECRPQVGILYLELLEEIRKISRHLENINDRAGMFYAKLPNAAK
jgi:phosphate:Na+ symporter